MDLTQAVGAVHLWDLQKRTVRPMSVQGVVWRTRGLRVQIQMRRCLQMNQTRKEKRRPVSGLELEVVQRQTRSRRTCVLVQVPPGRM